MRNESIPFECDRHTHSKQSLKFYNLLIILQYGFFYYYKNLLYASRI